MNKQNKNSRISTLGPLSLILALATGLSGCGDITNDGGASSNSKDPESTDGRLIQGYIEGGVVNGGTIKAYPLNADGSLNTDLAVSASITSKGTYALPANWAGPTYIEVIAEATNPITGKKLSTSPTMSAVLSLSSGNSAYEPIQTNINPLTTLFADSVKAQISAGFPYSLAQSNAINELEVNLPSLKDVTPEQLLTSSIFGAPEFNGDDTSNASLEATGLFFTLAALKNEALGKGHFSQTLKITSSDIADDNKLNSSGLTTLSDLSDTAASLDYIYITDLMADLDIDITSSLDPAFLTTGWGVNAARTTKNTATNIAGISSVPTPIYSGSTTSISLPTDGTVSNLASLATTILNTAVFDSGEAATLNNFTPKISSVVSSAANDANNTIDIVLKPASILDVYSSGKVLAQGQTSALSADQAVLFPFSTNGTSTSLPASGSVALQLPTSGSTTATDDNSFEISLNDLSIHDSDGDSTTKGDQIYLNGDISFDTNISASFTPDQNAYEINASIKNKFDVTFYSAVNTPVSLPLSRLRILGDDNQWFPISKTSLDVNGIQLPIAIYVRPTLEAGVNSSAYNDYSLYGDVISQLVIRYSTSGGLSVSTRHTDKNVKITGANRVQFDSQLSTGFDYRIVINNYETIQFNGKNLLTVDTADSPNTLPRDTFAKIESMITGLDPVDSAGTRNLVDLSSSISSGGHSYLDLNSTSDPYWLWVEPPAISSITVNPEGETEFTTNSFAIPAGFGSYHIDFRLSSSDLSSDTLNDYWLVSDWMPGNSYPEFSHVSGDEAKAHTFQNDIPYYVCAVIRNDTFTSQCAGFARYYNGSQLYFKQNFHAKASGRSYLPIPTMTGDLDTPAKDYQAYIMNGSGPQGTPWGNHHTITLINGQGDVNIPTPDSIGWYRVRVTDPLDPANYVLSNAFKVVRYGTIWPDVKNPSYYLTNDSTVNQYTDNPFIGGSWSKYNQLPISLSIIHTATPAPCSVPNGSYSCTTYSDSHQPIDATLKNASGRIVWSKTFSSHTLNDSVKLDAGTYTLTVHSTADDFATITKTVSIK